MKYSNHPLPPFNPGAPNDSREGPPLLRMRGFPSEGICCFRKGPSLWKKLDGERISSKRFTPPPLFLSPQDGAKRGDNLVHEDSNLLERPLPFIPEVSLANALLKLQNRSHRLFT
ncbi:hypothetical protein CDAR_277551 [Caerostris darwini]|uniref:Uncharacterized protein n=1 Tax=Caerostris darwini TaxID=1538125 RepID=A0AAV4VT44_9ARAC|nr:hypothetical protein CDAR_277551 [Caerostris darwini]